MCLEGWEHLCAKAFPRFCSKHLVRHRPLIEFNIKVPAPRVVASSIKVSRTCSPVCPTPYVRCARDPDGGMSKSLQGAQKAVAILRPDVVVVRFPPVTRL